MGPLQRSRRPLRIASWTRIALAAGVACIGSLLFTHFLTVHGVITPTVHWHGLSVHQWMQVFQVVVTIGAAAGASYWILERPLHALRGRRGDPAAESAEHAVTTAPIRVESAKDLSLLYEIGQEINSTIELDELFGIITQMIHRHFQLNEFAILLLDETRQALRVRAAYGFSNAERIQDLVFQLGEGVSGEAAQTGRLVYVRDTRVDRRYLHYRGEHHEDGSFLSIPLRYKKEILGVINFSRRGVASFARQDIRLLTLVANQIALAIANAKLYMRTRELSVRDDLTTLYNRRYFQQVLQVEWKRAVRFHRNLSVLMIDVDRFKVFNDSFGHLQGDQVLQQMAAVLRNHIREVDTIARFGGEEFVVLLPDTDKQGALAVGEKLRQLVEQERFPLPADAAGHGTPLTVSIGVAVYPDDVREMEDLIDHADIALYEAKDVGRNRVVCYPQPGAADPLSAVATHRLTRLDS